MENLEEFVDKLIEEKGFAEKDADIMEQIRLDLMDRVEDRINAMIMSSLPESALPEFDKMIHSDNEQEISEFIQRNIPNFKEKVAEELMSFRTMYLG